jgi:predicted CXXCH cytochrome family protein
MMKGGMFHGIATRDFLLLLLLVAASAAAVDSIHQQTYNCFVGTSSGNCTGVCTVCHPPGEGDTTMPLGGQAWNPGMATVQDTYPALYPREKSEWSTLEPQHRACKSCHLDHAALIRNHPVAVEYSDQYLRSRLHDEPVGLPLFDNKVLCASCHNPHSNARALLRKEDWQSSLCLSCHY